MNNNNSSKQILLSVLGVAILVVAVVGISFAAFSYSKAGEKENTITTGTITMSYTEDTNGISLVDALPITDATGIALKGENNYFDFTVDTKVAGTTSIDYAITAIKDADLSTLPDDGVKIYLTKRTGNDDTASETAESNYPQKVSELTKTVAGNAAGAPADQYILKTGTIAASTTDYYRLRLWVSNDYSETNGGVAGQITQKKYVLKVNVYGAAKAQ